MSSRLRQALGASPSDAEAAQCVSFYLCLLVQKYAHTDAFGAYVYLYKSTHTLMRLAHISVTRGDKGFFGNMFAPPVFEGERARGTLAELKHCKALTKSLRTNRFVDNMFAPPVYQRRSGPARHLLFFAPAWGEVNHCSLSVLSKHVRAVTKPLLSLALSRL
jgi:hypothetical protein